MTPNRQSAAVGGMPSAGSRPNLADPLQVAVEVTELKGTMAMFQQQLSTGLNNNTSMLGSLQAEVRELSKVTGQVATLLAAMESHSAGLGRAFDAINAGASSLNAWREKHEAENRQTADQVTTWRGVVLGIGLFGALLLSAAIYIVQKGFADAAIDRDRIESHVDSLARDADARLDALELRR
jgi:hypothetical protein